MRFYEIERFLSFSVSNRAGKGHHFDHGYAMTTHKAQGVTVDRAIINIDSTQKKLNSRNDYYVDISRARNKISIYTDSQKVLTKQVGKFTKKIVDGDFATRKVVNDKNENLKNKEKLKVVTGGGISIFKESEIIEQWRSPSKQTITRT